MDYTTASYEMKLHRRTRRRESIQDPTRLEHLILRSGVKKSLGRQTLVLAYSTGQPLSRLNDDMAAKVAKGWKAFSGMGDAHLRQRMHALDRTDPSYRD